MQNGKADTKFYCSKMNPTTCMFMSVCLWVSKTKKRLKGSEVKDAQACLTLCNTWTIQSMEFSRPEHWSGQPFPSSGDLPNPGIELRSPTLWADSLPTELSGKQIGLLTRTNYGLVYLLHNLFFPSFSIISNIILIFKICMFVYMNIEQELYIT